MSRRCLEVAIVYSLQVLKGVASVDPRQDEPPPDPRRTTLIALVFVGVLVIGGLFLTHELRKMSQIQDCAMQGRSNCAPID
jgi:hypothetical protein